MMFNYPKLWLAGKHFAPDYQAGNPFPFFVFDNFLPKAQAYILQDAFPSHASQIWKTIGNPHTYNRVVAPATPVGKNWQPEVDAIFNHLMEAKFLLFMENLTGINGLISDPYFADAGFYAMRKGGFLDIHADLSHHDKLGLERRCNLIIYLNDDWKPEYKGDLVLYDQDLNEAQRVAPVMNRAVVFGASETSFYGNPEILEAEESKAISMWYYTLPTGRKKHGAIFPKDPTFVRYPTAANG